MHVDRLSNAWDDVKKLVKALVKNGADSSVLVDITEEMARLGFLRASELRLLIQE